jgi:cysteine desulfurase / selenocysteine lyase
MNMERNSALSECRRDFPVLQRLIDGQAIVYLDNAATTLKPKPVIEAISNFYSENGANIHRGKHYLSEEASNKYEDVRSRIARFIGAYANEIVFVKNTTEALNLVAWGLTLDRNDLVIGCLDSHHSQLLPWRRFANLKLVRFNSEGRVDLDHFTELLRLRPKVVALTHCSNVTGALAPIETMALSAKQACEPIVVVDAAQSLPHFRIDLSRLAIDFLAFSAHKMLGPTGIGCLYGRRQSLESLRPLMLGGGTADWVDLDSWQARKVPYRFEAGTPPIASVIGFGAALDYLERVGEDQQLSHERFLTELMITLALEREYIDLLGPRTHAERCGIASMRIRGCESLSEVARCLSDSYGVMCRSGHLCAQPVVDAYGKGEVLRAAAYIYNTPTDIRTLFRALDELVAFMAR